MGLRSIARMWCLGPQGGVHSVAEFLRDPSLYLRELRRKRQKKLRLGRQACLGIEPGTSCLPALGVEQLGH